MARSVEQINLISVQKELSSIEELRDLIGFIDIIIHDGKTKISGKKVYIERKELQTSNPRDIGPIILRELFQVLFSHSSRGFRLISEAIDKDIATLAAHAVSNSCIESFTSTIPGSDAPTNKLIPMVSIFKLPKDKICPTIPIVLAATKQLKDSNTTSQWTFERLFYLIKSNIDQEEVQKLLDSMKSDSYFLPDDIEFTEEDPETENKLSYYINSLRGTMAGNVSGELLSLIQSVIDVPKEPWYKHLARFVVPHLGDDKITTWNRPNRRRRSSDIVLPGKQPNPSIKNLVVIIDSSGSMSDRSIESALGHIKKIQLDCKCSLNIVVCDCEVKGIYPVKVEDTIESLLSKGKIVINGRGGTSFKPAQLVACNDLKASVIVIFTDGYGDFLDEREYSKLNGPPLLVVFTKVHSEYPLPKYAYSICMNLLEI